ncbi:MAG: acyl-CoA dehydrogenase family protein [Polymorphobacter sp.]|uniref:acyl-CoA dehydrogenase family protein n=1 Tax=Polymorphobacter sp. TaxID=1909290 RepID=UPI003A89E3FE
MSGGYAQVRTIDPDFEAQLLDSIDKWVERELAPVAMAHDHADEWPAAIVDQMAALGLFGATIGEEYGGLGLPAVTYARNRGAHLQRLDGADRHLQFASDPGAGDREIWY